MAFPSGAAKRGAAVLLLAVPLLTPLTSHATDLLAHRAVYDLKLNSSKDGSVTAATGQMNYEMLDVCDGWATRQRLKMDVTNSDGQTVEMLSDYTTYETKDGLRMQFRMRQTTDEAVTSDIQGNASLLPSGGAGTVQYILPHQTTMALPRGTLFPTAHTARILADAEAGDRMVALPLFDGTSEKGAQDSSIVISKWSSAPRDKQWPVLARLPSGKFHLAFWDMGPADMQPDYEVTLRYWANGVADDLTMDFGDFVMDGNLKQFTPVQPHC